jgi:hypothetical protein
MEAVAHDSSHLEIGIVVVQVVVVRQSWCG